MKRRSMLCMIAAAFLLCWGGMVSCSSDSNSPSGSEDKDKDKDKGSERIENGDGTFTLKIQEDGDGFVSSTGDVKTEFKGYTGDGYLDGLTDGGNVVYTVLAEENISDAKIAIHYCCTEESRVRGAYVTVNDELLNDGSPIAMTYTFKGNKNDSSAETVSQRWKDSVYLENVSLRKGENLIVVTGAPDGTYTALGGTDITIEENSGCLNYIDYLIVTGKGIDYGTDKTPWYALSYRSENETAGSVTGSVPVGSVKEGTEVELTAEANARWEFECWSDGVTKNPYPFEIEKATTLSAHFIPKNYTAPSGLVGYATITSDEGAKYTITGGAGATETNKVTIASHADLVANKDLLASHEPKIITIRGKISTATLLSEKYTVGSNTTIYGDTENQGRLQNIELSVEGENVIIRNMMLGEVISWDTPNKSGADDALSLNGATHVWIDHCEFQSHLEPQDLNGNKITSDSPYYSTKEDWKKDFYDGLLDIKNGSTWITISNCYFHDHWKACLCSSGDGKADTNPRTGATDVDMRVTFYGNYWKDINARQPLFRWGKAHVFNSYFHSEKSEISGQSTGINCRAGSEVYIDHNTFENIKTPIGYYNDESASRTGYWVNDSNDFPGCTNSVGTSKTDYKPPYTWTPERVDTVKTSVPKNAGVGKLTAADLQ